MNRRDTFVAALTLAFAAASCAFPIVAAQAQASPPDMVIETNADGAQFPFGSRLGLKPPPGMAVSKTFPGFEDLAKNAFIRLVALPDHAFGEIEKSMNAEALKKQSMMLEKREALTLPAGRAILVLARQDVSGTSIRKWLLIAQITGATALVSFEIPNDDAAYPESAIRASLSSLAARAAVPAAEQLGLAPFTIGDLAGLRVAGVVPGRALQLTDGPKDLMDTIDQAHLIVGIAAGAPASPADRDSFARLAFGGLPNLKDTRIVGSEPLRISGQPGHEIRAVAKDGKTGVDVEIVQWLRFGGNAYLRILGVAPKSGWTETFGKFRAVRDSIDPR